MSPPLSPAPGDVDHGIFSGNCFVNKDGEATMLYHGCDAGNCIATSAEPNLDHWTKLPSNPIVPNPAPDSPEAKLYQSWDPHGWLEGDTYYAVFGGNPPTLFKADRLDHWTFVGKLLTHDMPDVVDFEDISCPDLFALGDCHVLLCISHSRGCRYYVGRVEGRAVPPRVAPPHELAGRHLLRAGDAAGRQRPPHPLDLGAGESPARAGGLGAAR